MFRLDLAINKATLAILSDPAGKLLNMQRGIAMEVDQEMFGPGKELEKVMRAGARGGGPHNWRPLTKPYLEWKRRAMARGENLGETLEQMGDVGRKGQRKVPIAYRRALRGELRAHMERLGFTNQASARRYLKTRRVISTDIWVRTGATREQVIRATLKTGRGTRRVGSTRTTSGKTGLRHVIIETKPIRLRYGVKIDDKIKYAGAVGAKGKRKWPGDLRPLLEWTPAQKAMVRRVAAKWAGALGKQIEGKESALRETA